VIMYSTGITAKTPGSGDRYWPPAVYSSIAPRAHLYESTIDDYRLRVTQGSTGSLLWAARVRVAQPIVDLHFCRCCLHSSSQNTYFSRIPFGCHESFTVPQHRDHVNLEMYLELCKQRVQLPGLVPVPVPPEKVTILAPMKYLSLDRIMP
jgi:hypothetical protein